MSQSKLRVRFKEPQFELQGKIGVLPSTSRIKLLEKPPISHHTSRSLKVSPERDTAKVPDPKHPYPYHTKTHSKSTKKFQVPKSLNFTPMISPKLQPKSTHRRICSDYPANIYKSKVIFNMQNIEKLPVKKTVKKSKKSESLSKFPENTQKNDSPYRLKDDLEKNVLIKYISQYYVKYKEMPITSIEFYKVIGLIGKGAFGKVLLCEHKLSGKQVAVKAISKVRLQSLRSQKKVFQEVYILRKIRNRFVIKILEVFESERNFLIVLEYAGGGDLLNYVRNKGRLKEEECKKIFRQIVQGALSIHEAGVLHRDFKLDNILLDTEYSMIKICDFGVSKIFQSGELIKDQCGTPAYLAPEIIKNQGYQGGSVDIWSIGIVLYTMLCGTIPFKASNVLDLHKVILTGVFEVPLELSQLAGDLLKKIIVVDPHTRYSLEEILNHPWFATKNPKEIDKSLPQFFPCAPKENYSEKYQEHIIAHMADLGFPIHYTTDSLISCEINHATATYYLLS